MKRLKTVFDDKVSIGGKFGGKAQYVIQIESPSKGIEANYFSIIRAFENQSPFGRSFKKPLGEVIKVKDFYTAAESSSYWGNIEQRKGLQQDKFQQFMANIGQMLKTLFQLLRELRILDERLQYYEDCDKNKEPAWIALKSMWIDLVEGGAKSPGSVYGLAMQVGFATLPDLFFTVHPRTTKDVDAYVNRMTKGSVNRKVREVLSRKLYQFLTWKEKTYQELRRGQQFKLKYMRQHYHVIKLYLLWMRPYLKNIQRLQMDHDLTNKDIVSAFETSKIELEVIGRKFKYEVEHDITNKEQLDFQYYFPCVRVKFDFVSIPDMSFQSEYQRGPIHRGKTIMTIEGFVATQQDIDNYRKNLDAEDFELLEAVDSSITALKDDLEYYLEKAGELKEDKEDKKKDTIFTPFKAVFSGFKEMVGLDTSKKEKGDKRLPKKLLAQEKAAAKGMAKTEAYLIYYVFKKTNKMYTE